MKFSIIIFTISIAVANTAYSQSLESFDDVDGKYKPQPIPGINILEMPEPIFQDPPLYLDVDKKGNVINTRLSIDESGNMKISNETVTPEALAWLHSRHKIILKNIGEENGIPSDPNNLKGTKSSNCPLPGGFTLTGLNGNVYGKQQFLNTNRPSGATTQWLTYDFWTRNFRQSGSHMVNILRFHNNGANPSRTLHGWGNLIGDNHGSSYGCGNSSRFNSEVEAWYQLVESTTGNTPLWQSKVFPQTCGREMYDGGVLVENDNNPWEPYFLIYPKYRVEIQAASSHWVAYRILRFTGASWVTHTNWKGVNIDTANWLGGIPNFNENAQGVLLSATEGSPKNWSFYITNVRCGWF